MERPRAIGLAVAAIGSVVQAGYGRIDEYAAGNSIVIRVTAAAGQAACEHNG